jgi:hypothetical protein
MDDTVLCLQCLDKSKRLGDFGYEEWVLSCLHFVKGVLRDVRLDSHCTHDIDTLEKHGFIVSLEIGDAYLRIKPLGHRKVNETTHEFCVCKKNKTPSRG